MNLIRKATQLRLGTLNVHFFTDLQKQLNVDRLVQFLKPMSLDVLALQEALHTNQPPGYRAPKYYQLKRLSGLLQLPHTAFCNIAREFGNAILSKFPLTNTVNYLTENFENHIARGMLTAQIDHEFFNDNNATLHVIHLDQLSEDVRLKQLNQFEKYMHDSDFQLISISKYKNRDCFLNNFA